MLYKKVNFSIHQDGYWEPFKKSNEVEGARGGSLGGVGGNLYNSFSGPFCQFSSSSLQGSPGFFQDCFNVRLTLNQEHSKSQPSLFK